MTTSKLDHRENLVLAARLREMMARQRISRETLADKARLSLSTLEKGLSGQRPFTLATIVRLETALGLELRSPVGDRTQASDAANVPAPDELGGYSRASVEWLAGSYLTLIPSFTETDAIYAYRTDIAWDQARSQLAFKEFERLDPDFTQFGSVSVPLQSGHVYLVTNRHGQYRLAVLARPSITGEMHGILTTLQAGRGSNLTPIAVPMVLQPLKAAPQTIYGRIRAADQAYPAYAKLLARTMADGFARFLAK